MKDDVKVYHRRNLPAGPRVDFKDHPSRTKQSFREEANINSIMARYRRTGVLPLSGLEPLFGDFRGFGDYLDCQLRLKGVQERFESLPARVRERFKNRPAELMFFMEDEGNLVEAQELGLVKKPAAVPAAVAPAAPAAAAPAAPALVPPAGGSGGGTIGT